MSGSKNGICVFTRSPDMGRIFWPPESRTSHQGNNNKVNLFWHLFMDNYGKKIRKIYKSLD